ncbi:MAG: AI-2E family transporter [Bacteroidetes bacterium]|nr:AI-2E family transporter [Bacteroidota bacterium]
MSKTAKFILGIGIILVVLYLMWYFSEIVVYLVIASVLAIIGHPLVHLLGKIRFGKIRLPRSVTTAIALLVMVFSIGAFIMTFAPMMAHQVSVLKNINIDTISHKYQYEAKQLESFMLQYGAIPPGQDLETFAEVKLQSIVKLVSLPDLISRLASFTGSLFIGVFSVLFISFFLWKDEKLLINVLLLIIPTRYHVEIENIINESKRLLSRYFLGLLLEIITVITLESIGLTIIGVKNAFLIGFLGGMMNIIPYLGPLIGAGIAVFLGVTTSLGMGIYSGLLTLIVSIIIVFSIVKVLDDIFLQPIIYSSSIKAHPLEIFLVIMMAGTLGGIPGMILAIPVYTIIRVIAREFFSNLRIVQKLTEKM